MGCGSSKPNRAHGYSNSRPVAYAGAVDGSGSIAPMHHHHHHHGGGAHHGHFAGGQFADYTCGIGRG